MTIQKDTSAPWRSPLPLYNFHNDQHKRLSAMEAAGPLLFRIWDDSPECGAPLDLVTNCFVAQKFKNEPAFLLEELVEISARLPLFPSAAVVNHVVPPKWGTRIPSPYLSTTPNFLWAALQARKCSKVGSTTYVSFLRTDQMNADRMAIALAHIPLEEDLARNFAKLCQEILIFGYTPSSALVATFTFSHIEQLLRQHAAWASLEVQRYPAGAQKEFPFRLYADGWCHKFHQHYTAVEHTTSAFNLTVALFSSYVQDQKSPSLDINTDTIDVAFALYFLEWPYRMHHADQSSRKDVADQHVEDLRRKLDANFRPVRITLAAVEEDSLRYMIFVSEKSFISD
jgi:hypothetical protein